MMATAVAEAVPAVAVAGPAMAGTATPAMIVNGGSGCCSGGGRRHFGDIGGCNSSGDVNSCLARRRGGGKSRAYLTSGWNKASVANGGGSEFESLLTPGQRRGKPEQKHVKDAKKMPKTLQFIT